MLLVILPVLTRHISKGEFNYNVDETQHAFTCVFFADLIHDHPIHNPVEYTSLLRPLSGAKRNYSLAAPLLRL